MEDDVMKFKVWKRAVDQACEKLCGMSSDDLPDCSYWDWFMDEVTPIQAARRAIKQAMN